MGNNLYNLNNLNLDDLEQVSGGRYVTPEEQMQIQELLTKVARIRYDLIAKDRYEDASQVVQDYNAIVDAYYGAISNSPEGSATVKFSDFVGDTLSKYGM